ALTLAVSGPTSSPEYLPLRVADAEGYFAKEGLTVTVKTTRAEPGAAEALAQGQADLAATSLEAMLRFGPRTSASPRATSPRRCCDSAREPRSRRRGWFWASLRRRSSPSWSPRPRR